MLSAQHLSCHKEVTPTTSRRQWESQNRLPQDVLGSAWRLADPLHGCLAWRPGMQLPNLLFATARHNVAGDAVDSLRHHPRP
jgi:hypothetical protein